MMTSGIARRARAARRFSSAAVAFLVFSLLAAGVADASLAAPASAPGHTVRTVSTHTEISSRSRAVGAGLEAAAAAGLVVTPRDGGGLAVYDVPGAPTPSQAFPATNELGSPVAFLTVARQSDWFQVLLPTRPNGATAWIPVASVNAAKPVYRIEVSLANHDLRLIRNGDGAVVLTSAIGAGAASHPTPTGRFFVRDLFPTSGWNHPYGPFAFGLSGHSDVLSKFGTGDGRIAIHGTNDPSTIGVDASNGCVHVPNDVDEALIPLLTIGTPVTIS
jgi:lipoprotein-anchoring transpeptidase ErfK/SrfK